jgi:nitrile hydratase
VNPAFKARLLDDATAVVEESGIDNYDGTRFIVLEQTPRVHNLVVRTLCSCYPRPLLGLPPDWYKCRPYRSRAVREPRAVPARTCRTTC